MNEIERLARDHPIMLQILKEIRNYGGTKRYIAECPDRERVQFVSQFERLFILMDKENIVKKV